MECGAELIEGMSECPNCGCPVEEQLNAQLNEKSQKVEVTGVKVTRKIKIIIGIQQIGIRREVYTKDGVYA